MRADRGRILASYLTTRFRRRFGDRDELERWQAGQLTRTLRRLRREIPFYRSVSGERLDDFPVLDKTAYLAAFRDLNRHSLDLDGCLSFARSNERLRDFRRLRGALEVGLSSGTSGRQSAFLTSPAERATWAGAMLAKALPGALWRGARIALVLRAGGALYESLSAGRIRFRYFDLRRPFADLVEALEVFAPTVLVAPPQVLRLLASARAQGRALRPSRLVSVSEVLDPVDEDAIAGAFGGPVHQVYQAAEGFLGVSCAAGRVHLNEDLLVFETEWLDRASRRFTPIVTDLFRRTQAIVRVRLGDVLVASAGPCTCGSPLRALDRIEGRCDDLLVLPAATGDRPAPLFADLVSRVVFAASPAVEDFRLVQPSLDEVALDLRVSADAELGSVLGQVRSALVALVSGLGLVPPRVETAALFDHDPTIKVRRVRRTFPVDWRALTRPER